LGGFVSSVIDVLGALQKLTVAVVDGLPLGCPFLNGLEQLLDLIGGEGVSALQSVLH
jgi:hypothetical protein